MYMVQKIDNDTVKYDCLGCLVPLTDCEFVKKALWYYDGARRALSTRRQSFRSLRHSPDEFIDESTAEPE
jgi:hypothetical protein